MLFEKVDNYIFKIMESSEKSNLFDKDFKIIIPNVGIKGYLYNEKNKIKESYIIGKKEQYLGLNINKGAYVYVQKKKKFVDTEEGNIFLENTEFEEDLDFEYSKENFDEDFKNVEFLTFYESDKNSNEFKHYSFIVNDDSFLLLEYFHIFKDQKGKLNTINVSFKEDYMDSIFLMNRGFCDEKKIRIKYDELNVPDHYHKYYYIEDNNKEQDKMFFRQNIINKVYSETLKAYNEYYDINEDVQYCCDTIIEDINQRFKRNDIDERC